MIMSEILVRKSDDINTADSFKYKGQPKTFHLDEINDTEQDLIVLYMYILPKYQTHGIKVGMTTCKMDETFWHAIQSRIKRQKEELALSEDEYSEHGFVREVIHWGVCLDAHNESFKDYRVHNQIISKYGGNVEKEQEWFINIPTKKIIETFE